MERKRKALARMARLSQPQPLNLSLSSSTQTLKTPGGPLLEGSAPQEASGDDAPLGARGGEGGGAVLGARRKFELFFFFSVLSSSPGPPRPGPRDQRPAPRDPLLRHGVCGREGLRRPGAARARRGAKRRRRRRKTTSPLRGRGRGAREDPLCRRPFLSDALQALALI